MYGLCPSNYPFETNNNTNNFTQRFSIKMDMEIEVHRKYKIRTNGKVQRKEGNRMEKYYITVTSGMRGYFAVMIGVDKSGFSEPIQTSPVTCRSHEEAVFDAKSWARSEELEYKE